MLHNKIRDATFVDINRQPTVELKSMLISIWILAPYYENNEKT